jgi:hypothetical protein
MSTQLAHLKLLTSRMDSCTFIQVMTIFVNLFFGLMLSMVSFILKIFPGNTRKVRALCDQARLLKGCVVMQHAVRAPTDAGGEDPVLPVPSTSVLLLWPWHHQSRLRDLLLVGRRQGEWSSKKGLNAGAGACSSHPV